MSLNSSLADRDVLASQHGMMPTCMEGRTGAWGHRLLPIHSASAGTLWRQRVTGASIGIAFRQASPLFMTTRRGPRLEATYGRPRRHPPVKPFHSVGVGKGTDPFARLSIAAGCVFRLAVSGMSRRLQLANSNKQTY
jgi:hypothetical protein